MKTITITIRLDSSLGKRLLFPALYSIVLLFFLFRFQEICQARSYYTQIFGAILQFFPIARAFEAFLILAGTYLFHRATKGVCPIFSRAMPIVIGAGLSYLTMNSAFSVVEDYETLLTVFFRATHSLWLGLLISAFLLLFYAIGKHSGKTPRPRDPIRA